MSLPPGFRVVQQQRQDDEDDLPPGFRPVQSSRQQSGSVMGQYAVGAIEDLTSKLPFGLGRSMDALPRSVNLSDEMVGGVANVGTRIGNAVSGNDADPRLAGAAARDEWERRVGEYREEQPIRSFIEEGAGQVAAGMLTGGATAGTTLGRVGAGLATSRPVATAFGVGAADGALGGFGAGRSMEDRLQGAAQGGAIGAVTGGTLAGGGRLIQRTFGGNAARGIPEIEQLQAAKQSAYEAVDDLGARYSRPSIDQMVSRIRGEAQQMNINPARHPAAASTMQNLESILGEGDVSLTRLDQARQVIRRDVAASPDPAESAFGQMMINKIDDYIQNSGSADMVEGAAGQAASAIMAARSANQRFRKSELVADAIERAHLRAASTGSGGNEENAIRQNLRNLVQPGSRTARVFNDEERDLILRAVEGDSIQNALRLVSRFAPSSGGLSAMLGVGGAASMPAVAVPAMMLGEGAKRGAQLRQGALIDDVNRLIRTGSRAAPPPAVAAPTGIGMGIIGGSASSRLREEQERRERQFRP